MKDGFTFEVRITCRNCQHKKSFIGIVKAILDIIKLKIGPDGIEISKSE